MVETCFGMGWLFRRSGMDQFCRAAEQCARDVHAFALWVIGVKDASKPNFVLLPHRMAIGVGLHMAAATALLEPALATELALPQMSKCASGSQPLLPVRWHGAYLMAPFTRAQLMVGDVIYEDSLPAMRVKLYGLRSGSADFFVMGRNTYSLTSEDGCKDLGDTGWRPLPRKLLAHNAECQGSAPIAGTPVDWWKLPSNPAPAASWIWYKLSDQSPFRLMFAHPSDSLSVLSWYAFSYQLRFEALPQTDLASIARTCQGATPGSAGVGRAALRDTISALARSPSSTADQIREIAPELQASCPDVPLPIWPDILGMTIFMSPINRHFSPLPTEVLYDWELKSQRTRMHGLPNALTEDALLLGSKGYDIERKRDGQLRCSASQPGTVRSNWTQTAPCNCEAVINGKTSLTPYGTTRIMVCPMTTPRVLWSWYTLDGRPMVFMETSAAGDEKVGLLTLADYYDWVPGHKFAPKVFEKPPQCPSPPPSANSSTARGSHHAAEPSQCSRCHFDGTVP
jgi:hypothetical protein